MGGNTPYWTISYDDPSYTEELRKEATIQAVTLYKHLVTPDMKKALHGLPVVIKDLIDVSMSCST